MSVSTPDFSPAAAPLAEKLLESALEIIARYPEGRGRSALLPLLHLVQTEEGFVSPNGVAFCAEVLGINKAQVGAMVTRILRLDAPPKPADAADALALAITHIWRGGAQARIEAAMHAATAARSRQ